MTAKNIPLHTVAGSRVYDEILTSENRISSQWLARYNSLNDLRFAQKVGATLPTPQAPNMDTRPAFGPNGRMVRPYTADQVGAMCSSHDVMPMWALQRVQQ
jgi:hypothetical protein